MLTLLLETSVGYSEYSKSKQNIRKALEHWLHWLLNGDALDIIILTGIKLNIAEKVDIKALKQPLTRKR